MMHPSSRIYVAGHTGLAGSAICRELRRQGFHDIITRTRGELDLLDAGATLAFLTRERPTHVFVAAARVGGIWANNAEPASFLWENLQIQGSLIHGAWRAGVRKLLFLGSSCIYPKLAPQPLREESLMSGPLEPTNEAYAVAKIAGIKLCQALRRQHGCDFISAMPANLYGPNDRYHPTDSHVLPAMIRRLHEAKARGASHVECWGSGSPLREFLHADDLARAVILLMETYSGEAFVNVGSGDELSIRDVAELVRDVVGFRGKMTWDASKPDGTPRKVLDSSKLRGMGWRPEVPLRQGIEGAYADFLQRFASHGAPASSAS